MGSWLFESPNQVRRSYGGLVDAGLVGQADPQARRGDYGFDGRVIGCPSERIPITTSTRHSSKVPSSLLSGVSASGLAAATCEPSCEYAARSSSRGAEWFEDVLALDFGQPGEETGVPGCPGEGAYVEHDEQIQQHLRCCVGLGAEELDLLDLVQGGPNGALEQFGEHLVLPAGVVVIEAGLPDPNRLGDVSGRGRGDAPVHEQAGHDVEDLLAWLHPRSPPASYLGQHAWAPRPTSLTAPGGRNVVTPHRTAPPRSSLRKPSRTACSKTQICQRNDSQVTARRTRPVDSAFPQDCCRGRGDCVSSGVAESERHRIGHVR